MSNENSKNPNNTNEAAIVVNQPAQPVVKEEPIINTGNNKTGVGLDVGTMFFVGARENNNGQVITKQVRDAFVRQKSNPLSLKIAKKFGYNFLELEGPEGKEIVIVGNEALEAANVFKSSILRRPMSKGVISSQESDAFGIIKELLKLAVGEPKVPGELIKFSVPADPIDANYNVIFHQGMFSNFLSEMGYTPSPMNEALAIAYSELATESDEMTGILLSFGAGNVNICFSYLGEDALSFAVARSGDWIDENAARQVAGENYREMIPEIIELKESDILNIANPDLSDFKQASIVMYYRALLQYVFANLNKRMKNKSDMPNIKKPIKIIYSGGTSLIPGFGAVAEGEFKKYKWPFEVKEFVKAKNQLTAVSEGLLSAALFELS